MPFLVITALTLGGVGLYLAMPGGRLNAGRAALIVLAGAAAALVTALARLPGASTPMGWFIALSLIGFWGAIRVITHRKPVYSALYFVLVAVAVSGLLLLAEAEFLAAALLIIYAGAILVTYVFVIMLAQRSGPPPRWDTDAREPLVGVITGFILLAVITLRVFAGGAPAAVAAPADAPGVGEARAAAATIDAPAVVKGVIVPGPSQQVAAIGTPLLTHYAVAIQLAGLLLLGSMVGAIAIARRKATDADVREEAW
jgi:NADH-quinone oxidoreductase subunit J